MADDVLAALASAGKKKKRKKKRCSTVKRTKVVNGKRKVVKVRKCKPRKKPAKKKPEPVGVGAQKGDSDGGDGGSDEPDAPDAGGDASE